MEFTDSGHLKEITDIKKGLGISIINQGFYWYASKFYDEYKNT